MPQILPRDLPPVPGGVLNPNSAIVADDGSGVFRPTPAQITDAGAPINSQVEAEAGVVNSGRMSPLRVKQAIDALGVSQDVLAAPTGGEMVGFSQGDAGAISTDIADELRKFPTVTRYGAVGNGSTPVGAFINAALAANAGGSVTIPNASGDYIIEETIEVPDFTELVGFGWGITLKRGFDGPMFKMGKQSKIRNFVADGNAAAYPDTDNDTIVIEVGTNSPTPSLQGHQVIERVAFINTPGYPIHYTVATMGWMSKVEGCFFQGTASDAAIKWPDDAGGGGNRKAILCYSDVAIVNVGGSANGIISFNTTYGANAPNQGVIFPAGEVNRVNKTIVTNNRFAIANGTMNIRGVDLVFSDNIIAGSVVFENNSGNDGATNCVWSDSNTIVGTLTDSSGAANKITFNRPQNFTPVITATGGGFVVGPSDVRGEYTRQDDYITANYFITFLTGFNAGTGQWRVSLPVNRYTALNTDFFGSALARNQSCAVRTLFNAGDNLLQILTSGGSAVGAGTPGVWANGDVLGIQIRYRIF